MWAEAQATWQRAPRGVRWPVDVVRRTFHLYYEDRCGTYAAAIAYYAIFSLVPLGLLILSVLGLVVDRERIVQFVFDQVPLKETANVRDNVDSMVRRAQQATPAGITLGLAALIWSGSGIFAAVRQGLSATSHRSRPRPFWRGKLIDFALVPALGLLILLSIGLTAIAQGVIERAGRLGPVDLHTNLTLLVVSYVLPSFASFAMFCVLYRYVPSVRPNWREALTGAVFASLLFEGAKNLYAALFAFLPFTRDTAIYAGFGTALAFLFWMFINASILLLGAEFARAVVHGPEVGLATTGPARAPDAAAILPMTEDAGPESGVPPGAAHLGRS
ncbi:MAG: YihY/virulence factor BrkB family protein [Gemmataceae bacterium]|nr:YihY/virulence factor BrkB family protein [Gemmataceae bacterium]